MLNAFVTQSSNSFREFIDQKMEKMAKFVGKLASVQTFPSRSRKFLIVADFVSTRDTQMLACFMQLCCSSKRR